MDSELLQLYAAARQASLEGKVLIVEVDKNNPNDLTVKTATITKTSNDEYQLATI